MTAAILRRECPWCTPPRPIDGLGPILAGQPVSHGICEGCRNRMLREAYAPLHAQLVGDSDPDGDFHR